MWATRLRIAAAIGMTLATAVACNSRHPAARAAAAVWTVDRDHPPTATAASFTAMVSRLACSGGLTGHVLDPSVTTEEDRVVVTFKVTALAAGNYTCPGNNEVPYLVELKGPIGKRRLVDGACVARDASTTSFCSGGGVRWTP
jgi:hypothetical protein